MDTKYLVTCLLKQKNGHEQDTIKQFDLRFTWFIISLNCLFDH